MTGTNKMREQFEVWHKHQVSRLTEHGEHLSAKKWNDLKWMCEAAWQASREAVVVDLSDCVADLFDGGSYYDQCKVDEAIEAQGLKVKP